jgi:predicted ATPase/class 3 adenylate cyclase/DNA-binding CsgD family transcriptional regulator
MSEIDSAPLKWSDLGVSGLVPTGTVTLLLADVEGSTRLWQTQPEQMTAAFAGLDRALAQLVDAHHGVRPIEQGEGDSFVIAFGRASDAVACALDLQRAALAPIRLRIGLHTGEVQLRDEANYIGPTINRTARLRDLAHGAQTVLSGATEPLVVDALPDGAWLTDLGTHTLRDFARPERVSQLCHPELANDFPPLRTTKSVATQNLPAQLTSFVGRRTQIDEVSQLLTDNRLVTLTGAGGAGKTRLAVEVAAAAAGDFDDGVWYVDLAPIANPLVVPITVARTVGLPDQPGRSTMETLLRYFADRFMLLLLDNCEHLLDACGELVIELLNACPRLTILATSREQIGVAGEVTWRVPSLSLADEAVELFVDRARRARPGFGIDSASATQVGEICRRLDGMPLAIELAAARVRSLSLAQIVGSLNDRFRLLTGGARTAVRRQQTLRASVDWSHTLLTEPERVLLRRLAVFMGDFDLDAAQAVGAADEVERYQILDQLGLLVDKSLVLADDASDTMRYRMLETVRQYALEKLGDSGEADAVRSRHRDYYTDMTATLERDARVDWADLEIDNLRAAYEWSRETGDFERGLGLVSSLQRFWVTRSRITEGLAGFDGIFGDKRYRHSDVAPAAWIGAVADYNILAAWLAIPASLGRAQEALAAARKLGEPELLARALHGCGGSAVYNADLAEQFFGEAIDLLRQLGGWTRLSEIRSYQGFVRLIAGFPADAQAAVEEGRDLADASSDTWVSQACRVWLGIATQVQGRLADAAAEFASLVIEAEDAGDVYIRTLALVGLGQTLASQGHADRARDAATAALDGAGALGGFIEDTIYVTLANAALAAGDAVAARAACETAMRCATPVRQLFTRFLAPMAEAALACGDLAAARRWADDTVAVAPGWNRMVALTARAIVAVAQGEPQQAEHDLHDALAIAPETGGYLRLPDTLECLARLVSDSGNHQSGARLFGAAAGVRQRSGEVRFAVFDADHDAAVTGLRIALSDEDFDRAWDEGARMSTAEAIAYARRGHGESKRPAAGWEALTPTELDVVRLVREGLGNKDIGTRLFISPRTVQTHLTHVYNKLGLSSRVQLVQEAARHA